MLEKNPEKKTFPFFISYFFFSYFSVSFCAKIPIAYQFRCAINFSLFAELCFVFFVCFVGFELYFFSLLQTTACLLYCLLSFYVVIKPCVSIWVAVHVLRMENNEINTNATHNVHIAFTGDTRHQMSERERERVFLVKTNSLNFEIEKKWHNTTKQKKMNKNETITKKQPQFLLDVYGTCILNVHT